MTDLTSEAKVPLLPLNSTPQYMLLRHTPTCMLHIVTLLIGYHAFLFHGRDYGMAAMLKNCRHLELVRGTRTF